MASRSMTRSEPAGRTVIVEIFARIRDKCCLRVFINSLLKPYFEALAEEMRNGFKSLAEQEKAMADAIQDIKDGWDAVKGAVSKAATDIDAAADRIVAAAPNNTTLQAIAAEMKTTASDLNGHSAKLEGALNPPADNGGGQDQAPPADGGSPPADGGAAASS